MLRRVVTQAAAHRGGGEFKLPVEEFLKALRGEGGPCLEAWDGDYGEAVLGENGVDGRGLDEHDAAEGEGLPGPVRVQAVAHGGCHETVPTK